MEGGIITEKMSDELSGNSQGAGGKNKRENISHQCRVRHCLLSVSCTGRHGPAHPGKSSLSTPEENKLMGTGWPGVLNRCYNVV